ncbi:hypothetical protein DID88_008569 [Monilinia fructigena]|uniref:Apple domain-containing protein n=1 Tax=Monilinia fructigena TaxID=38457 RepID=A0A395J868_9HELO|nr:hypothetical protein DID88_008569 [Monilinia fructigena]
MKPVVALSAFLAIATATPFLKPRSLDISAYKAVSTAPQTLPFAAATSSAAIVNRRNKRSTCPSTCAVLSAGNGPSVNNPDTASAFEADKNLANAALKAATPADYVLVDGFQNVDSAAQSATYLTYVSDSVTSYDPAICANACNAIQGCIAFNIFFERDPTLVPDTEDCPNPPSQTLIKCSLFGGLLDASLATNSGQWQADFQVVIAGSNAYNAVAPPSIPDIEEYKALDLLPLMPLQILQHIWELKPSLRLSPMTQLCAPLLAVQRVTLVALSSCPISCTRITKTECLLAHISPFLTDPTEQLKPGNMMIKETTTQSVTALASPSMITKSSRLS